MEIILRLDLHLIVDPRKSKWLSFRTQFAVYIQCDILAGNIVKFVSKTSKQRKNETRHRRENSRHFSGTQLVEILYQFYGTKRKLI